MKVSAAALLRVLGVRGQFELSALGFARQQHAVTAQIKAYDDAVAGGIGMGPASPCCKRLFPTTRIRPG